MFNIKETKNTDNTGRALTSACEFIHIELLYNTVHFHLLIEEYHNNDDLFMFMKECGWEAGKPLFGVEALLLLGIV